MTHLIPLILSLLATARVTESGAAAAISYNPSGVQVGPITKYSNNINVGLIEKTEYTVTIKQPSSLLKLKQDTVGERTSNLQDTVGKRTSHLQDTVGGKRTSRPQKSQLNEKLNLKAIIDAISNSQTEDQQATTSNIYDQFWLFSEEASNYFFERVAQKFREIQPYLFRTKKGETFSVSGFEEIYFENFYEKAVFYSTDGDKAIVNANVIFGPIEFSSDLEDKETLDFTSRTYTIGGHMEFSVDGKSKKTTLKDLKIENFVRETDDLTETQQLYINEFLKSLKTTNFRDFVMVAVDFISKQQENRRVHKMVIY